MAISFAGEEAEAMSDINVTPLVDVMLVLLIIFIITIRVIIQQVNVELPKATNLPTQTKPENITIAVDKEGEIFWNTQKLSGQDDLKARLRITARIEPQPEIHIRGDANVRYQFVGQVLVATQQIGIRKVAFITTPDHFGPGTVVKPRDARMVQPRENLALRLEAHHLRRCVALQELDRDSLLEIAVGALGFIHFAHAAAAEQARDAPGAETQSQGAVRNQFFRGRLRRHRQKSARRTRRAQQTFNFGEHGGILDAPGAQIRNPLCFR